MSFVMENNNNKKQAFPARDRLAVSRGGSAEQLRKHEGAFVDLFSMPDFSGEAQKKYDAPDFTEEMTSPCN